MPVPLQPRWPILLTWPLAVIGAIASAIGLFVDSSYDDDAAAWVVQARAQDAVDLFVVLPLLVASALVLRRTGSMRALVVWLGALVSLVYAFAIYAFDMSYGPLFLPYVACLGLSAWALVGGARMLDPQALHEHFAGHRDARAAGLVLAGIGTLFYGLWLAVNLPAAFDGSVPAELAEVGLPTNPVHVLDMALLLPACLVGGIALWRGRAIGAALVPVLLVALLCITAGIEMIFAFEYADSGDTAVVAPAITMLAPALAAGWSLVRLLRRMPAGATSTDMDPRP